MSKQKSVPPPASRKAAAGLRGDSDAAAPATLVVGITGASGAAYAVRLVECVVRAGWRVQLIVTEAGRMVLADEVGAGRAKESFDPAALWPPDVAAHVTYLPAEKIDAGPASGSFAAAGMVVIPCSMNTLAALAHGLAGNLVQRAAYVALKEGRPLVVVPREMPMTTIDFDNMARLAAAGAAVLPAMPGFYHRPRTVADLVDFVVAKVLDRLGIAHTLAVRWPGGGE
jgi:flavin prenyltransferase